MGLNAEQHASLTASRDRNAAGALMLWKLALHHGDELRVQLARSILAECGYPGGEDAPPLQEAVAAIVARDGE